MSEENLLSENKTGMMTNNELFINSSALQLRLNTEPLLVQLEANIRGIEYYVDDKGETRARRVSQPLFSTEEGIRNYMTIIRSVINTSVVQGFTNQEHYQDYLCRFRKDLAKNLMINRLNYGLNINNYSMVISLAMNTIELFISRTIDNKERDGYNVNMRVLENTQQTVSNRGLFSFSGK